MKNKILKPFATLLFLWAAVFPVFGQRADSASKRNDASATNGLTIQAIQRMVYSKWIESYDVLQDLGYQLSVDTDTIYDTIDYFRLTYVRRTFLYDNIGPSLVSIMTSEDKLCNYVTFYKSPKNGYLVLQELSQLHYSFSKERSAFQGSFLNQQSQKIEQFEVTLHEDDSSITVTCKNIEQIRSFLQTKKDKVCKQIDTTIAHALDLAAKNHYSEALDSIETAKGLYPPKDNELARFFNWIQTERNNYYTSCRDKAITDHDYAKALAFCDTLLSLNLTNADQISNVRKVLLSQINGEAMPYRQACPDSFDSLRRQVQRIVNQEIRTHSDLTYDDVQQLDVFLHIHTSTINESQASFNLVTNSSRRKMVREYQDRRIFLAQCAEKIAHQPLIEPVKRDNIFVITDDTIQASIRWQFSTKVINPDNRLDSTKLLDRFIDTIERKYFYIQKVSKNELNEDGTTKMISIPKLPTKRIYTFGQTEKEMENMKYVDIELVDFETALGTSWIPSLFIPGLGTYQQGARPDVVSRALPFFLFGGLGVAGLIMEKKFANDGVERPTTWEGLESKSFIYLKNFGYWAAGGCFAISGTIYLTDLIGAIRNSVVNSQRSKALRKQLKKQSITLQKQDVIIQ